MRPLTPPTPEPRLRRKPLKAVGALAAFVRNKEDTEAVFRFVRYLDAPVSARRAARFAATAVGRATLSDRRDLAAALSNRARLADLPAGSLGRAYLGFVERENISPEGFQRELDASGGDYSNSGNVVAFYTRRIAHMHDLFHVVTGYGRDFVGELALLAFSEPQYGSLALAVIRRLTAIKAMRDYPGLRVWACMAEGHRLGRRAADLTTADWEGLLPQPLALVRKELRIAIPRRYLGIQAAAENIDRRYRERLAAA